MTYKVIIFKKESDDLELRIATVGFEVDDDGEYTAKIRVRKGSCIGVNIE